MPSIAPGFAVQIFSHSWPLMITFQSELFCKVVTSGRAYAPFSYKQQCRFANSCCGQRVRYYCGPRGLQRPFANRRCCVYLKGGFSEFCFMPRGETFILCHCKTSQISSKSFFFMPRKRFLSLKIFFHVISNS